MHVRSNWPFSLANIVAFGIDWFVAWRQRQGRVCNGGSSDDRVSDDEEKDGNEKPRTTLVVRYASRTRTMTWMQRTS